MEKQSIPNNPVVLLQRNAQVLQTIISKADQNTPIVAFIAMQKNNTEAIRIMEAHDKDEAFTIVPKAVVTLCRQTIEQNAERLRQGIQDHKEDRQFVKSARLKLRTYHEILNRLPISEPPAAPALPPAGNEPQIFTCKTCGTMFTTLEAYRGHGTAECLAVLKQGKRNAQDNRNPPGHKANVKLSAKTHFDVERKGDKDVQNQ